MLVLVNEQRLKQLAKFMGWDVRIPKDEEMYGFTLKGEMITDFPGSDEPFSFDLWNPAENIGHAFMLLDRVRELKFQATLVRLREGTFCEIRPTPESEDIGKIYEGVRLPNTDEEAICNAIFQLIEQIGEKMSNK